MKVVATVLESGEIRVNVPGASPGEQVEVEIKRSAQAIREKWVSFAIARSGRPDATWSREEIYRDQP